jgi:chromosome transmission fidelity protein 4
MDKKGLSFIPAHSAGVCDLDYIEHNNSVHLVTSGQDGKLCFRNDGNPSEVIKTIQNENNGAIGQVHCSKASPGDPYMAIGDEQNFVKLFSFPSGDLHNVATRFTLPVRTLAFSPSGATLAAAGDDEGIKLIDTEGNKVFRTLKAQPYTRSIAYDPESTYLAAASADGALNIWEIGTGKHIFSAKKVCPKASTTTSSVVSTSSSRNALAWHPDGGSLLATPGTNDGDIVFYERLSWEVSFHLEGEHSSPVTLLSFSKNGLYLASAAADQSLVIWDVNEKKALEKRLLPGAVVGLAWHPSANALAVITDDGVLAVWKDCISKSLHSPVADVDVLAGIKSGPGMMANDGDGDGVVNEGDGLNGAHTDGMDHDDDDDDDNTDDDDDRNDGYGNSIPSRGGGGDGAMKRARFGGSGGYSTSTALPPLQEAIQPGSTSLGSNGRRYLAYNRLGSIILKEEEDHGVIEVAFHDTAKMRTRIPLLTDFFGISMGALHESGALYASKSSIDCPNSTIVFRAFEAWSMNADWHVGLPEGEDAVCVAVGDLFCAVATDAGLLRMFSHAGLQMNVVSLAGPPVAMAAQQDCLAIVWHASTPVMVSDKKKKNNKSCVQQKLEFAMYGISSTNKLYQGQLPLSQGASLVWLGFTTQGMLASYDSAGCLRVYSSQFGGSWSPIFSASAERKGSETYWPVGVSDSEMHCIVCADAVEPAVPSGGARPIVTVAPLRPPVLMREEEGLGVAAVPLEADFVKQNIQLGHYTAVALDSRDDGNTAYALEMARNNADRAGLKLLAKFIAADRWGRALELVEQLHGTPALEGALKLATHHKAHALSQRISEMVEARMEAEVAAAVADQQRQMDGGGAGRGFDHTTTGYTQHQQDDVYEQPLEEEDAGIDVVVVDGDDNNDVAPPPPPSSGLNPFSRKTTTKVVLENGSPNPLMSKGGGEKKKRKTPMMVGNPFARKAARSGKA